MKITAQKSPPARAAKTVKAIPQSDPDVYSRLYEAVLDHRLPPGTKLKEIPLAEYFGVTRGAIRKAFTQLAAMRIVDLRPNRGAIVASPSVAESRDLFAARRTIEGAIVESLAGSITKAQIKRLQTLIRQEDACYRRGETREALKVSVDFHRVLAAMAGNSVLAEVLDQLVTRTPLVVLNYKSPSHSHSCSNMDHVDIVAALTAGDARRAQAAMHGHLCNLEGRLNFRAAQPANELAAIFGRDEFPAALQ